MDTKALIQFLEETASSHSDAERRRGDEFIEVSRCTAMMRQHPAVERLLRAEAEVLALEGQRMGVGGHTWRFELDELSGWLLWETMNGRARAAVEALPSFASSRSSSWNEFVLLSGITCRDVAEILPGMEIVPFSHVPPSWSSKQLETALADHDPNWRINPDAAVLRRRGFGTVVTANNDSESRISIDDQVLVSLALTIGLGHAVMERGVWMQLANTTPLRHNCSWITQIGHEVYVGHRYMPERAVTEASVRLAATFLSGPADFKRRMVVPLQRYRLAL